MVIELPGTRTTGGSLRVTVSAPAELAFSLYVCRCRSRDIGESPEWARVYERRHGDVLTEIEEFWSDLPEADHSEILVLADRSGTLFDADLDRFFERFDDAASRTVEAGLFGVEAEDLRTLTARLEVLREDPERRRRYQALLARHWAGLEPAWRSEGRSAVAAAAEHYREAAARGVEVRGLLPESHLARMEAWSGVVDDALARARVVITPLYFGGGGQALVDLPGVLLVGVGLQMESDLERRRARARTAAERLKALSDPTRTALLMTVLRHPYSITDLAAQFSLAQPTISVHVRQLREAGLVESEKSGNQTLYSARAATVREFLDAAARDILDLPPTGDSNRA